MDIVRVAVISPPDEDRSAWVRDRIALALERNLKPELYPAGDTQSITAGLPRAMSYQLKKLAEQYGWTVAQVACGLIEAARADNEQSIQQDDAEADTEKRDAGIPGMIGSTKVRPLLRDLLREGYTASRDGKIVFAEAATGTGKGNMIACLAASAAREGDTVLIAAPLAVTWQLLSGLTSIRGVGAMGVALMLGRPNFVSPERLKEWAEDNECQPVLDWLAKGAPALSERMRTASNALANKLAYMLEDALHLAPDLPVDYCILDAEDDPDECPAEALYRQQRQHEGNAAIVICSHYMLAASCRTRQLRGEAGADSGTLPGYVDTLIVDEAHLLETAFAAINAHTLRLRPLIRAIESDVARGRKAAVDALQELYRALQSSDKLIDARSGCSLDELDDLKPTLEAALNALEGIKTKDLNTGTGTRIRIAVRALRDALSGFSRVRVDQSPVKKHPMLISGRANLSKAFAALWDNCAGAFLTSATLYTDGNNGTLIRRKLEAPTARVLYLAPVHPSWVTGPVTYMANTNLEREPDDSPEWADEASKQIIKIAEHAQGGTLILCTSMLNAEQLAQRLTKPLAERLITQNAKKNAAMCASQFRALGKDGKRPVWLGVGSAWTGIDLTDHDAEPKDDTLLTDLVIARLPIGLNRSITHERRVQIAGFRIVAQEAAWTFRQGLGRLVRREGVRDRKLWALDARLKTNENWVVPFGRLLARYKTSDKKET